MTTATPTATEPKPVLLRCLKPRWRGHYMLGPREAAGDLFWWNGKGKFPADTEEVDPATVNAPAPPKAEVPGAPGAGPRMRHAFGPPNPA